MQALIWLMASGVLAGQPADSLARAAIPGDSVVAAVPAPADLELFGPRLRDPFPTFHADLSLDSTAHQRPKAVEYSDFYYVRLAIHKYASYATIPLFTAEYFLGQSLYNNPGASRTTRNTHQQVAAAIGGLFVINTVTGVWNLVESRKVSAGRFRRFLHAGMMIVADAGFVATGVITPGRDFRVNGVTDPSGANLHRALAISSMGLSLSSYLMMLLWKD